MAPATTDAVRASLTAALEQVQAQHAEHVAAVARLQQVAEQLHNSLEDLSNLPPVEQRDRVDRKMQVSEERLTRVRDYILTEKRARQPDIARALGENTGTVSVAMRRLARDGLVVKDGLEKGATVWRAVDESSKTSV